MRARRRLVRNECPGEVECPELQTFLRCALGAGHLRPCTPDVLVRDEMRVAALIRFRRALETIENDDTEQPRKVAREALSAK